MRDKEMQEIFTIDKIFVEVGKEVLRATEKHPEYPTDPLHAIAILGEEFGELTQAALQMMYKPHKTSIEDVRQEAIQTMAMAIRFIHNIDNFNWEKPEGKKD